MKRGSVTNRFLDRHLGVPFLFATSVFSKPRRIPEYIERIGLLSSPALGDTLLNSGPVQDVRSHYPTAKLFYFSDPSNAPAVKLLPGIDEIVPISMIRPWKTIRAMRDQKLDLLIDFTSWQRLTAFFSAASGARFKVGFRSKNQHRHWHYDKTVEHSSAIHEIDNFRALLRSLGIRTTAAPKLNISESSEDLNSLFHRDGFRRRVVFHPWATGDWHPLREWPTEKWIELAGTLCPDNTDLLITGSPSQLSRSRQLCKDLASHGISAEPFLSANGLESLCMMLMSADLVVSVNTGVMHLSAILGAPTIALNGPTSNNRWGPLGPNAASVDPAGGGGYLHLGFEFAGNPKDCMQRTRVSDVVAAAKGIAPRIFSQSAVASA